MAKINIYFQDLSEEKQEELIEQIKGELLDDVQQQIIDNPEISPETIKREAIDDYINTHNIVQTYEI